jgi:hypothetical protein
MDVTEWLGWFLDTLHRAVDQAQHTLDAVLTKARFWQRWATTPLNERQVKLLNKLLDGFEGKLTSSKWAAIAKCSPDTALRDINDLLARWRAAQIGCGRAQHQLRAERSAGIAALDRSWNCLGSWQGASGRMTGAPCSKLGRICRRGLWWRSKTALPQRRMFRIVSRYRRVPTFRNMPALGMARARKISNAMKVRSPQAWTDRPFCCKSMAWHQAVRAGEGSCGFVRKDSNSCGFSVEHGTEPASVLRSRY